MKLIALDVGTKRIGVAKADSSVRIAVPYSAISVDGTEFDKIASLARAWDIDSFVLGLPRNSKGEETEQSAYVRHFAKDLKKAIPNAKICFQDESLTSVEAEKRLEKRKKGYKKGDIDSEAATIILQDFLEERMGKSKNKTRAASAKRPSVKAAKPHRLLTAVIIVLILLGIAGGAGYFYYDQNLQPVFTDVDCDEEKPSTSGGTTPCTPIKFAVESGTNINIVATSLKESGLIRNSLVFQIYYRIFHNDSPIMAGDYELNKAMSPQEIVEIITTGRGRGNVFTFTILPGETMREIKQKMVQIGYDEAEVEAAFSATYTGEYDWIFEGRPDDATLEGYLYGDTYEFYKNTLAEKVVERMLEEMADTLKTNDFQSKFAEHGLNLYQGITLASIVQREANTPTDQGMVAQIFLNRLGLGMSLGSDVTTIYAVDLVDPNREVYQNNADALQIDSPYNTRLYAGLPYGPISNPGLSALSAVASPNPEAANYLFFLTGDDGLMYYSSTEEGHNQNIYDYCQTLCNVAL